MGGVGGLLRRRVGKERFEGYFVWNRGSLVLFSRY